MNVRVLLLCLLGLVACSSPPPAPQSAPASPTGGGVVPDTEVTAKPTDGPSETRGIAQVDTLAHIDLREEFGGTDPLFFRLRRLKIASDGAVAMHEHERRPGVAYILQGAITEHRDGATDVKLAGDFVFEHSGVRHGWHNHATLPTTALVADILVPEAADTPDLRPLAPQDRDQSSAPSENKGLTVLEQGVQPLSAEGAPFTEKQLRLRLIEVAPAGIVGVHTHEARPSFAYIVRGSMLEHRGDGDVEHGPGSSVTERTGLTHWWENTTTETAQILVVDLIDV